jgi:hypothetical protein
VFNVGVDEAVVWKLIVNVGVQFSLASVVKRGETETLTFAPTGPPPSKITSYVPAGTRDAGKLKGTEVPLIRVVPLTVLLACK